MARERSEPDPTKPKSRGRPSKYNPAFVEQARKLAELGATDRDVADFFDVAEFTINRWKQAYPDFCASLKVGKEHADNRVEQSLYRRATGYTFDGEKIFQFQGEIIRTPIVEHVPPDTTAIIFWLKNRRPDLWRDRHNVEHDVTDKLADLIEKSMTPDG